MLHGQCLTGPWSMLQAGHHGQPAITPFSAEVPLPAVVGVESEGAAAPDPLGSWGGDLAVVH